MDAIIRIILPLSALLASACVPFQPAIDRDTAVLEDACRISVTDSSMEICEVGRNGSRLTVTVFGRGPAAGLKAAAARAGLPPGTVLELPETGSGWGLVRVPVATLHAGPGYGEPLSTQALLGTPVRLLQHRGWWRVQLPDGYIAWIPAGQITQVNNEELSARNRSGLLLVRNLETPARMSADRGSPEVVLLPAGAIVEPLQGKNSDDVQVKLPDGRAVWIDRNAAAPVSGITASPDTVLQEAKRFSGRSYLWAGTSPWGLDCSGFVRTAFAGAGRIIPRDARQQERIGRILSPWEEPQPGDLLLFGDNGKIGHIGLSLGTSRFIHSLADVHESSLSETDVDFDAEQKRRFMKAVRPDFSDERCMVELSRHPFLASPPRDLFPCLHRKRGEEPQKEHAYH